MEKEKISEKNLEKTAGGYETFLKETKFTGKALCVTQSERDALREGGFLTGDDSNPSIKPENFQKAQEYLKSRGFRGVTHVSKGDQTIIDIDVLKWFCLIFYLIFINEKTPTRYRNRRQKGN